MGVGGRSGAALSINLASCKYDILAEVSDALGYHVRQDDEAGEWDLTWTDLSVSLERVSRLKRFQRLNHFPGMLDICRKAALSRHITRMAARCPAEYCFYPTSLIMPDQLDELVAGLKRNKQRMDAGLEGVTTWIIKPSAGTMGRGISLLQTASQLQDVDINNAVAQQYVANPLLIDGFKFDLRIYALVASVDPLRVYLFDEGLARLATTPYQAPTHANLRTQNMHLTNYSVNKNAPGFHSSDRPDGLNGATKRLASVVLQQVADRAGTTKAAIVESIEDIIVKTILSIQPLLAHTYHTAISCQSGGAQIGCTVGGYDHGHLDPSSASFSPQPTAAAASTSTPSSSIPAAPCGCPASLCFEVLGFDIMIDDQLQPWLLEVNHSPSFACDSRLDRQVKSALITDTLLALGQCAADKAAWRQEQLRAQAERLYQPSQHVRRPLSAMPRSQTLQAAAAALDQITTDPPPPPVTAGGHHGPGLSSAHASSGPSATQPMPRPASEIEGSVGFIPAESTPRRARVGLFTEIFPPPSQAARQRMSKILTVAADAFPDQRCQCSWCLRRMRVRYLMSGAEYLHSRTSGQQCFSSGGSSQRPLSRSSLQRLSSKISAAIEQEEDASGGGLRPLCLAPLPAA